MASKVEICNLALGNIGQEPIGAISESLSCGVYWENTVKEVLQEHDWTFARKRAMLNQDSTSPLFYWAYRYVLPSDCLEPRFINEGLTTPEWIIEGNFLLTNESSVELVYTRYETDEGKFPPLFVSALATLLAANICPNEVRDFDLQKKLMQLYDLRVGLAKRRDSSRGHHLRPDQLYENYDWIDAR